MLSDTLKNYSLSSGILNIDFALTHNGRTVLLGWLAKRDLDLEDVDADDALQMFAFERADVAQQLSLSNTRDAQGVLFVVDNDEVSTIEIEVGSKTFPLKKQQYQQAASLDDLLDHTGAKRSDAEKFLKRLGLLSKANKDKPSKPKRALDADVAEIKRLVTELQPFSADFYATARDKVLPAVQRVWQQRLAKPNNADVKTFGAPVNAGTAIIIPLYGRYDFMQHQLATFAQDQQLRSAAEIIYVLDDPALRHEVAVTAQGLYQTFGIPFKLILSEQNLGFAGANNLAAQHTNAARLLLLNSDILPAQAGWLARLNQQFDEAADIGILGATLLYEDDTIQHMGMEPVSDSSYPQLKLNHHPSKGMPIELVPLEPVSEVPMVTGACMLIERALYEQLGGFEQSYVIGDFEDSDLCLKVREAGQKIYVSGDVRLYHLERLSQDLMADDDWKFKLTLVNAVNQMERWKHIL